MSAPHSKPATRTCTVLWLDYQLKSPNQTQYQHWTAKSRENKRATQALGRALLSSQYAGKVSMETTLLLLQNGSEIASLGGLADKDMDWEYRQILTKGKQGTIVVIEM